MLSESDKQRIRAEEIYREQVRKTLLTPERRSWWSFLDTQRGLFVASSVVLPLCIWLFTALQAHYSTTEATQKAVVRLDNEITYRITNYWRYLQNGSVSAFVAEIDHRFAYPQYQGIKMQILMLELEKQLPQAQREPIAAARQALISGDKQRVHDSLMIRGWYQP